jgi:hypothetical protein
VFYQLSTFNLFFIMPLANYNPLPRPVNNTPVDMNNRLGVHLDNNSNWLTAVNNHRQRAVGGGWDSTEIADQAVLSQNLFPIAGQNILNTRPDISYTVTGLRTITSPSISVNIPFDNGAVFIWGQATFNLETADQNALLGLRVQRATNVGFTTNLFTLPNEVRGLLDNRNSRGDGSASGFFLDSTAKTAGTYYYRLESTLGTFPNVLVTISERLATTSIGYMITNGVA